jgi:hypothetical protein
MTTNPLAADGWIGQSPGMNEEDLWQWCADKNRFAERIGADWWYCVEQVDLPDGTKRAEVVKREGFRAIAARAAAKGTPVRTWHPNEGEANAIHAHVARCIAEGMKQAEFNAMVDRSAKALAR